MNIYEQIGLKRVINASGRMTALGVSTLSDTVAAAVVEGSQSYVDIDLLMTRAGEIISRYTGSESSCVVSSASAGIAMSVAAVITKGNLGLIRKMPDSHGLVNEILIPKGHVVSFGAPVGTMIRMGGGVLCEVGMANSVTTDDFENAITKNTAALFYVKSHHCVQKGILTLESMIACAHKHQIPIIVDAAAEEDLKKYIEMGVDLVIYSGAKAIEAPTSGIVSGSKSLIDHVQAQYQGIGRPMKIGKEGIMGLLKALEEYDAKDETLAVLENRSRVAELIDKLTDIKGLSLSEIKDEAGREIYRVQIYVDHEICHKTALEIDAMLKGGNPSIHGRSHRLNEGYINLDTRPLVSDDITQIVKRFKEIMEVN